MAGSDNIFLTAENLAFSFPLILVCTIYAYFKFIPTTIGLPIIGVVALLYVIRSQFQKTREKKVVTMDDSAIKDLIREDETDDKENDKAAIRKAKNKVKARLAQEQKKADKLAKQQPKAKKGGIKDEDDDDDDDAAGLETFAKTSIKKKK